jgi:hypothetical protein
MGKRGSGQVKGLESEIISNAKPVFQFRETLFSGTKTL